MKTIPDSPDYDYKLSRKRNIFDTEENFKFSKEKIKKIMIVLIKMKRTVVCLRLNR